MSYDIWALKNLNKYRDSEIMQCLLWRPQYNLPEKLVNQVFTCFLTSCIKCMYVHTRINWTALMNHQKRASIFQVFSCVSKSYKGKIFLKLFSSIYTNLYHISSLQRVKMRISKIFWEFYYHLILSTSFINSYLNFYRKIILPLFL